MTNRKLLAEFAPGFNPFSASPTWVDFGLDTTDKTPRLREATWSTGRDDELEQFPPGTATLVLKNYDRYLDPDYTAGPWFGELLPYVPVRLRSTSQSTELNLPGTSGAYLSTPDHTSLDITGNIDIRGETFLADWTPGVVATLVNKFNSAGNQASYMVQVDTLGRLRMVWTTDGTLGTLESHNSTVAAPIPADGWLVWRATVTVNFFGNTLIQFTTCPHRPTSDSEWVLLGDSVVDTGTTSIFNSNAPLIVGGFNTGVTEPPTGRYRWLEVRNGVSGTVVANPDFTTALPGVTSFGDGAGRTWTTTGAASLLAVQSYEDEFYGFVTQGFEQQLAPQGAGECVLQLVDLLGVLGGYKLPDVFHQALMDHNPVGMWVCDGGGGGSDSESVPDMGSGRNDGTLVGEGVTLGDKPIAPGHDPAARFDVAVDATTLETTYGAIEVTRSRIIEPPNESLALFVVTFLARSKASLNWRTLFVHGTGSVPWNGMQAHIDTAGKLVYQYVQNGTGTAFQSVDAVVGKIGLFETTGHIMFGAGSGLGLDTPTLSASPTTSLAFGSKNGFAIGGGRGIQAIDHMDGWIGCVALFASHVTVGLAGRTAIFDAFNKLAGETSDVHISWALDHIGVPAALRNLDVGSVLMGPTDTNGRDALDWMREVTVTEGGSLYIDHRDGGVIRFTNRYARFLNIRSTTSQATFTDEPSAHPVANILYPAEGLELAPNGLDGIINQVTVTWHDGEIVVEDAASINPATGYGPRSRQIDTQATTADAARSAGEWVLANYAQPRSRVRGVTASAGTFDRHDKVQALRIDDRVTFRIHPQRVGTATTVTLFVDGITNTAVEGEWRTSFRFAAPATTFSPWVWGTSAWNTTAYWG